MSESGLVARCSRIAELLGKMPENVVQEAQRGELPRMDCEIHDRRIDDALRLALDALLGWEYKGGGQWARTEEWQCELP